MASAASARSSSASASAATSAPKPIETAFELQSARPSFSVSATVAIPARRIASSPGRSSPANAARPRPTSGRPRLAQSMRSEVPIDPICGTKGTTPRSSMASCVSTMRGRAPAPPRAKVAARTKRAARTTSSGKLGPAPEALAFSIETLKALAVFGRDGARGAVAEAPGQPVDRPVGPRPGLQHGLGREHAVRRRGVERRGRALPRHAADVRDGDAVLPEGECHGVVLRTAAIRRARRSGTSPRDRRRARHKAPGAAPHLSAWRGEPRTDGGSGCRPGARPRLVASRPESRAGERHVELLGLVRMGRIVDVRPEHQDPAGDRLARDRAAQPDQLGPAVAFEERGAEIRRRVALLPSQRIGMRRERRDERCGRGDRRPPRGIEPGQDRERARGHGPGRLEIRPALEEGSAASMPSRRARAARSRPTSPAALSFSTSKARDLDHPSRLQNDLRCIFGRAVHGH